MKVSLVTCLRSVVSSGYSGFLHLDMTLAVDEALSPITNMGLLIRAISKDLFLLFCLFSLYLD